MSVRQRPEDAKSCHVNVIFLVGAVNGRPAHAGLAKQLSAVASVKDDGRINGLSAPRAQRLWHGSPPQPEDEKASNWSANRAVEELALLQPKRPRRTASSEEMTTHFCLHPIEDVRISKILRRGASVASRSISG
jgi:hypothetical protein